MSSLLKADVQRSGDEIKRLILSRRPFEDKLFRLYTDLRLSAQHDQLIGLYHFLRLYTGPRKTTRLYHPALLQALILREYSQEALKVGQSLLRKNSRDLETKKLMKSLQVRRDGQLPAYTPLMVMSRYARHIRQDKQQGNALCSNNLWEERLRQITPQKLEELGYYEKKKQLDTLPLPYRTVLQENFDEFLICYILGLERSVIGLTGTLLEMLFALHLYKKQKRKKYLINKQHKNIFELSLNDLLVLYNRQRLLPKPILHLCQAARTQRNFIHPGKEVLEKQRLTLGGVQICFLAVMETIDCLLKNSEQTN